MRPKPDMPAPAAGCEDGAVSTESTGPEVVENRREVGASLVASLDAYAAVPARTHVVLIPGLGTTGYLVPLVRAVASRGLDCSLLDLPGFSRRTGRASPPTIDGIAQVAAAWVRRYARCPNLVLAGHSTGAQAALRAAVVAQEHRPLSGVLLAGLTMAPTQRDLLTLVATSPWAYRRDSPRELKGVPDFARGGMDLVRMLLSGIADRPERTVASLRCPLTVTAGRQDSFAPRWWLDVVASGASRSPSVGVVLLPGSHNNPYTHPAAVADLVVALG